MNPWLWIALGSLLLLAIPAFAIYTIRGWWTAPPQESGWVNGTHRVVATAAATVLSAFLIVVIGLSTFGRFVDVLSP